MMPALLLTFAREAPDIAPEFRHGATDRDARRTGIPMARWICLGRGSRPMLCSRAEKWNEEGQGATSVGELGLESF